MRVLARIISGSRLHLGFYNINYGGIKYGGVGLYIQNPRVVLEAREGDGLLIGFPEEIVAQANKIIESICTSRRNFSLVVRESPPIHTGLGVSTQILLSTAKLASALCDRNLSFKELVKITGRGRYSGIGIHAFRVGGFVVDGGTTISEDHPPLIFRVDFPSDWKIALVIPKGLRGLRDNEESVVLDALPSRVSEEKSRELISIAFAMIIRGVSTRNFDLFVYGVELLQRKVGELFSVYQGGIFSTRETGLAVDILRKAGFKGTGQSSWGPVAYGFALTSSFDEKIKKLKNIIEKENLDFDLIATTARNKGALLRRY